MKQISEPRKRLLHSPDEATRQALDEIDHRRNHIEDYVNFGIPAVDTVLTPLGGGDVVFWLGRPGHAKTGNAVRWARYRSKNLSDRGVRDRVPVFVTAEDMVGNIKMFMTAAQSAVSITTMARGKTSPAEMDRIKRMVASDEWVKQDNIWFIGVSQKNRGDREPLNIDAIVEILGYMEKSTGLRSDSVFIDYLQLLDPEPGTDRLPRTEQLSATIKAAKSGSISASSPWIVNAQAKRDVDDRAVPIPLESDGQWASMIEQAGQVVMASVRPIKYRQVGEEFDGHTVESEDDMVLALWKQKLGPPNKKFRLRFAPQYNRLDQLESSFAVPDYMDAKPKRLIEF